MFDQPLASPSAEAYAIRAAVHWAVLQRWERVQMFSDCLSIVKLFNYSDFDFSVIGPVLADVKTLVCSFIFFRLEFIPRDDNSLAHKLARCAVR